MNNTKRLEMAIHKPYEKGERENGLHAPTFMQKIAIVWHKHHYVKYRYLAEGCINKKIKMELEKKKVYHFNKYMEIL